MADYQNYISNHGSGASEEPDDDIIPISHEKLDDLTGGDAAGHYHLTQTEYEKLAELLETREDEQDSTALTEDEYTKLMLVVEALKNDTDEVALLTRDEYNRLMQMLEARTTDDEGSEPVFFSEEEYLRVTAILNAAYPNDSTEPVFVNTDTLNALVDARIQQNAETLINERIQQETSSIVDEHIQKALNDLSYEDIIDLIGGSRPDIIISRQERKNRIRIQQVEICRLVRIPLFQIITESESGAQCIAVRPDMGTYRYTSLILQ